MSPPSPTPGQTEEELLLLDYDVELPDGRTVSVAEYGDPAGWPVVHLHGAASCRFEAEPFDGSAKKHGVRVIAFDRPGVGRSTAAPGRTVLGYGYDVGALADALRLEQFTVAGFSNGGMYAFGAAHVLGDRISKVVPINPATPVAHPDVKAELPLWARVGYAGMSRFPALLARLGARHGITPGRGLAARLNPDRQVMAAPEARALITRINAEPKSGEYALAELTLGTAHWGFDHLAATQPVELFTGERDGGRRYAEIWTSRLPNATLHQFPGGHFGHLAKPVAETITSRLATR